MLTAGLTRSFGLSVLVGLTLVLAACGGGDGASEPGFGLVDWPDNPDSVGAEPGQRAPNFQLEKAAGGEMLLSDEIGTPILLNFFASWCTNCREEMAALDAVAGDDVKVIGVNLRESADTVIGLGEETGATFPMVLDKKGTVSREYRATSLPVTVVIDSDGTVLEYIRGPVDEESLADLLNRIRSGVEATSTS